MLAPLALVVLSSSPFAQAYIWEYAMLLGFSACGGLAALPLLSARWFHMAWRRASFARAGHQLHEFFSIGVVALVVAHAALALMAQPVALEYLKPSAPAYMYSGVFGLLLLVVLIMQGKHVRRVPMRFSRWRWFHRIGSAAAIGLAGHHIVASGFYLSLAFAVGLVLALAIPSLVAGIGVSAAGSDVREGVSSPPVSGYALALAVSALLMLLAAVALGVRSW